MNDLQQLIKERLEILPPEVARAIESIPWLEKVKEIAQKHNLDEDETDAFTTETALVVLGVEPPPNYPENLADQVGLDDDVVVTIATEVDAKVLQPILDAVNNTQETKEQEPEKEKEPSITEGPIVITHETKEEALKELSRRAEQNAEESKEVIPSPNLPMIEPGEVAHDVASTTSVVGSKQYVVGKTVNTPIPKTVSINEIKPEKPQPVPIPDYRYPGGKDPYREPIQ